MEYITILSIFASVVATIMSTWLYLKNKINRANKTAANTLISEKERRNINYLTRNGLKKLTITSISVTEDTIILHCVNMQRSIVRITIDREDLYKLV